MKTHSYKVLIIIFTIIAYIMWFAAYSWLETGLRVSEVHITIVSWIGIVVFIFYLFIWKKLTGRFLTMFNLFLCFFTLFNFGQSFLWALGIHTSLKGEIGNAPLYGVISYDNNVIVRAQLVFVICFITLNLGAILFWRSKDSILCNNKQYDWNNATDDSRYKKLYITSAILLAIALPATMYIVIRNFALGQLFSYHDLYYGNLKPIPTFVGILDGLFFPSLIGVLIGKKYDNNIRIKIYFIFAIYAIVSLMCGDRGEWINKLALLFWADTWFHKRIEAKTVIKVLVIIIIGAYIITPFVELRNVGLSAEGIKQVYSSLSFNPIVSMLVEFGHTMGITMVLISNKVIFPYGNSYLMSFVTILSTRWAEILFGIKYKQVSTWFSSDYLHILYGADFSMIGEAILNYGVYLAPLVIAVLGFIISKLAQLPLRDHLSPLSACLSIAAMEPILKMSRSIFWYPLTRCVYFVMLFVATYYLVSSVINRRNRKRASQIRNE